MYFTCLEEKEGRYDAYTDRTPEKLLPVAYLPRPSPHLVIPAEGLHLSGQQVHIYSTPVDKAPQSSQDAISTMPYNENAQVLPKQGTSKHLLTHEGFL